MKIAGIVIIVFGLIDLIGSFAGFDLWGGFLAVDLPDILWQFSAYIEMIIGYGLFNLGSKSSKPEQEEAAE